MREQGIDLALRELLLKIRKKGANEAQVLASDVPCSELTSPCTPRSAATPDFSAQLRSEDRNSVASVRGANKLWKNAVLKS